MKIIQIIYTSVSILGLGDDSKVYKWEYGTSSWKLYGELPKELVTYNPSV
jgi:hypothetical protein